MIEAFGAPAVGKSYVTEALMELPVELRGNVQNEAFPMTRDRRIVRAVGKLTLTLRYLPQLVKISPRLWTLVRCTPWRGLGTAVRGLSNWVQLLAMLKQLDKRAEPILLSQGILQAIWSLHFRARPSDKQPFPLRDWLELTLAQLPARPLVILQVVADDSVVQRRLTGREQGQSVMDRSKERDAQARSIAIIEELDAEMSRLAEQGRLSVATFDNSSDSLSSASLAELAGSLGLGTPLDTIHSSN
ncbi:hypothetical protein [Halomonas mongoliensis]|uniref:hypothetical protein n=1 Tax=Halomonas mongoliensis TaxID=321265 RepID=UPI00403B380A